MGVADPDVQLVALGLEGALKLGFLEGTRTMSFIRIIQWRVGDRY